MPIDNKRIYGLHIYSPRGGDYRIEIEREVVRIYENNDAVRASQTRVLRTMSELATRELPGPVFIQGSDGQVQRATYANLQDIIAASAAAIADEEEALIEAREQKHARLKADAIANEQTKLARAAQSSIKKEGAP